MLKKHGMLSQVSYNLKYNYKSSVIAQRIIYDEGTHCIRYDEKSGQMYTEYYDACEYCPFNAGNQREKYGSVCCVKVTKLANKSQVLEERKYLIQEALDYLSDTNRRNTNEDIGCLTEEIMELKKEIKILKETQNKEKEDTNNKLKEKESTMSEIEKVIDVFMDKLHTNAQEFKELQKRLDEATEKINSYVCLIKQKDTLICELKENIKNKTNNTEKIILPIKPILSTEKKVNIKEKSKCIKIPKEVINNTNDTPKTKNKISKNKKKRKIKRKGIYVNKKGVKFKIIKDNVESLILLNIETKKEKEIKNSTFKASYKKYVK